MIFPRLLVSFYYLFYFILLFLFYFSTQKVEPPKKTLQNVVLKNNTNIIKLIGFFLRPLHSMYAVSYYVVPRTAGEYIRRGTAGRITVNNGQKRGEIQCDNFGKLNKICEP